MVLAFQGELVAVVSMLGVKVAESVSALGVQVAAVTVVGVPEKRYIQCG